MSAVNQLFSPLSYLRISHPLKSRFDFYIPFFTSIVLTIVFLTLPEKIQIFGKEGFLTSVSGILQMLTGFFIASLAAISTFQSEPMDKLLSGDSAILKKKIKGNIVEIKLSRRRFLSYLFGYLSLLSFFLYFLGVFANLMVNNFLIIIPVSIQAIAKWSFVFTYLLMLSNLIVTTLLGLHYMTDRIHRQ